MQVEFKAQGAWRWIPVSETEHELVSALAAPASLPSEAIECRALPCRGETGSSRSAVKKLRE